MHSQKANIATHSLFARRSLWLALGLIVLLGAGALLLNLQPDSRAAHHFGKIMLLLPVAIVLVLVWLGSSTGARATASSAQVQMVRDDELRNLAMQRAFRCGFLTVLLCQPALLAWFFWLPLEHEAAIMTSATVLAGWRLFSAHSCCMTADKPA